MFGPCVSTMPDYRFKIVRFADDFVWHSHADTDETFVIPEGALRIDFRDGAVGDRSSCPRAKSTSPSPRARQR